MQTVPRTYFKFHNNSIAQNKQFDLLRFLFFENKTPKICFIEKLKQSFKNSEFVLIFQRPYLVDRIQRRRKELIGITFIYNWSKMLKIH